MSRIAHARGDSGSGGWARRPGTSERRRQAGLNPVAGEKQIWDRRHSAWPEAIAFGRGRHRGLLLLEHQSFEQTGAASGGDHRVQIADDQVEQFFVARVNQLARAANHETQIAVGAFAMVGEYAALVEEPLGRSADKADESRVGYLALTRGWHRKDGGGSIPVKVCKTGTGAASWGKKPRKRGGPDCGDKVG